MKKFVLISAVLAVAFCACKKDLPLTYNSHDNVYFDVTPAISGDDADSIVYSFAFNPGKSMDTVWLNVNVAGNATSTDRKFKIVVTDSLTTAKPTLDYEALKPEYTMPAGKGVFSVPIIVYSQDTLLNTKQLTLRLALQETSDFGVALHEVDTARILLSNSLQKPDWWDIWIGNIGTYSRVKFELFIRVTGQSKLSNNPGDFNQTPLALFYISQLNDFLRDPFKWVVNNPTKGYVIDVQDDGNYYFYNMATPDNKYELVKNPNDNKYYFVDENGNLIIPVN
jgi:hypothetical protein